MNLSLIQRLKIYLSKLNTSSSFVISLILCFSLKQPFSLLFKLLGLNDYFFLLSGLFSGLVTYTKAVNNMEIPSKKPLYLSMATGAFVSLFFYLLAYSGLNDVWLFIGLSVLSFFDTLPGISSLHGLNSRKLSVNKDSISGFKDEWRKTFFGNKLPAGGFVNAPLDNPPSQKTNLLSERARGKKPEMSGSRSDPQQGSSRGVKRTASEADLDTNNDNLTPNDFDGLSRRLHYKIMHVTQSRVDAIIIDKKPIPNLIKSVTLADLDINKDSPDGKLISKFAEGYRGDVKAVKDFCKSILGSRRNYDFRDTVIYSMVLENDKITSNTKEKKIINAISEHRNN